MPVDTSTLVAFWSGPTLTDEAQQVYVTKSLTGGVSLRWHKGVLPMTIRWDPLTMYSDSLPFPDLDPRPRIKAELYCSDFDFDYMNCPIDLAIKWTDVGWEGLDPPFAWTADSMIFYGDTGSVTGFQMELYFEEWYIGSFTGPSIEKEGYVGYPNPVSDELHIKVPNSQDNVFALYDLQGRQLPLSAVQRDSEFVFDVRHLPPGAYTLKVMPGNDHFPIIKIND